MQGYLENLENYFSRREQNQSKLTLETNKIPNFLGPQMVKT
jgi:hypothetical protein